MKKFVAVLLCIILLGMPIFGSAETDGVAEATDISEWDEWINQRFANVSYQEVFPYQFYKIVAEEHTYEDEMIGTSSYISRSAKFTIEDSWISTFTINYDLYDRGFRVYFNQNEKGSLIKKFCIATLMVLFYSDRAKAEELVNQIVPTYDGKTRSEYIYSDDNVVYLRSSIIGGTELVVAEREYFDDANLTGFREMSYSDLTAFLNQGDSGYFTGELVSITKGSEKDNLNVRLDSGDTITLIANTATLNNPFVYIIGHRYTFYVRIQEQTSYSNAGDITIRYAFEISDK